MRQKGIEQYQDYLNRLFPVNVDTDGKLIKINGRAIMARTVTFQVTDACNLCCTYCYQINKHHNVMPFDVAKHFIDMLLDATPENNEYINPEISPGIVLDFIGGEPLLQIDLISQISDYFIAQAIKRHHPWATRFMFSICTNGVLYFDDRVQEYIKKHFYHLSFSISIDGNKELHDSCRVFPDGSGSYDIAIKGVHHFTEVLHGHLGSKMTLAPSNIKYVYDAVTNLVEIGYRQIYLNCVYEKGWTITDATILYEQLKKVADYLLDTDQYNDVYLSIFEENFFHPKKPDDLQNWCGGNGSMIAVDYKGDIYPCLRYMESSLGDKVQPIIMGNVYTGMMTTQCQRDCIHCLQAVDRRTQSTDECFNCPIAEGCSWCTAYNYQTFGTADCRATYICCMHKARALANCYYWNKVYQKGHECKVHKLYVPDDWALEIISHDELNMLKELERSNENV
jgi:radical SAM peptide maturase (CXXX-repeat target family)